MYRRSLAVLVLYGFCAACGPGEGQTAGATDTEDSFTPLDPDDDPDAWLVLGHYELTARKQARFSCDEGFDAAGSFYFVYTRSDFGGAQIVYNECESPSDCEDRSPGWWSANVWDGRRWRRRFARPQYQQGGGCILSVEETTVESDGDTVTANIRVYAGEFDLERQDCNVEQSLDRFSELQCESREIMRGVKITDSD